MLTGTILSIGAIFLLVNWFGVAAAKHNILGRKFSSVEWESIKSKVDCWPKNGTWEFNNKTIIDDIKLYRKCNQHIYYGPKNPCAWILDLNSLKYDWKDSCNVPRTAFNHTVMCQVLNGRDILFVGDSVTNLFYSAFREELLLSADRPCPNNPDLTFDCGNNVANFTIRFARNDELSLGRTNASHVQAEFGDEVLSPWEHLLRSEDVVVLNRGAHYHVDSELIEGLNATLRYLSTHHPRVTVVYRNTLPGVEYKSWVTSPPLTKKPVVPTKWHWDQFEHQNDLTWQLLQDYPHVLPLDVFSPTVLRQDAHYDHIHYCIPGPLSTWVDMLYNALLLVDRNGTAMGAKHRNLHD